MQKRAGVVEGAATTYTWVHGCVVDLIIRLQENNSAVRHYVVVYVYENRVLTARTEAALLSSDDYGSQPDPPE